EQIVERQIDHVVGRQLPAIRGFANRIIAGGPLQKIVLQPLFVRVERGDDRVVRFLEFTEQRLVFYSRKGRRYRCLEEPSVVLELIDRDLRVDPGRAVEVLACLEIGW